MLVSAEIEADDPRNMRPAKMSDKPWPARFAYYVVTNPDARWRPEIKAFIDWVMEEVQGMH
ncbi:hypothetical protein [Serratia aquatilis]|uniref:LysR substrate-binding domain-containing protein n=1 Tax=Serratia aquatilis TaxID=1737515 RepID=A0ABV6E947_9GAMM